MLTFQLRAAIISLLAGESVVCGGNGREDSLTQWFAWHVEQTPGIGGGVVTLTRSGGMNWRVFANGLEGSSEVEQRQFADALHFVTGCEPTIEAALAILPHFKASRRNRWRLERHIRSSEWLAVHAILREDGKLLGQNQLLSPFQYFQVDDAVYVTMSHTQIQYCGLAADWKPGADFVPAVTEYRYGLRSRPPGPGAVPKGFIPDSYRKDDDRARWGTLAYPRELTAKEIYDFELVELNAKGAQS